MRNKIKNHSIEELGIGVIENTIYLTIKTDRVELYRIENVKNIEKVNEFNGEVKMV